MVKKDKKPKKISKKFSEMKKKHPNLLTPEERNLTSEEASIMGKMGGEARGKAIKERKNLKERLTLALEIWTEQTIDNHVKKGELKKAEVVRLMGADGAKLIDLINGKLVKSDTKLRALSELWDRIDGKAIQKNEHSGGVDIEFTKLQFVNGKDIVLK